MQHLTGFAPLAARYGGFIVDLWGVVHDGVHAYPGAVDCLAQIRAAGKKVVLLSNAPRRAASVARAMERMGIPRDHYTGIMTSGEAAHLMLQRRDDPWFAALGRRVYHLGPGRDRGVLEGLDLLRVDDPADADFVLNTGPDDTLGPVAVADFEPVLRAARAHRLKMICANPDLEVIRGGQRVICAGALAERYAEMGGEVRSLGKPDPTIYDPVIEELGLPRAQVLAVGDGLGTDIAGAGAAGIDACWVLGGIHHHEEDHAALAAGRDLRPVASIPAFVW